jgi:hypothetical protein
LRKRVLNDGSMSKNLDDKDELLHILNELREIKKI